VGGVISNVLCGYISDKYDERNYMIKTYVQMAASFLGIPTSMGVFLVTGNFYVSMTSLFLKYMLSEGWISPSISMI
jgi:sugar phosphate permease